ncbi:T9SS type B sorting domain-containing protein [Flavobacterium sp. LT1R49]|uniref:Ig-like domain-containing protein n=1 Tax=Flavobacterium arabinosi TaxID=3398737 RepID=UPI003A8AE881
MRFSHFFKIIVLLLFICSKATFASTYNLSAKKDGRNKTNSIKNPLRKNSEKNAVTIDPPKIKAEGNQTYCPQTYVKIATSLTITNDPAETSTNAVYIQISSGYVNGQDQLTLTGSYPNIISNWIPAEGKLILSSSTASLVPYSDFETAIKNVEFYSSSPSPSGIKNFSISLGPGQANYLPRNGHFYEYVPSLSITWSAAKAEAETKTYYGLQGYLATITAADEAQLVGKQAPGAGWIGGSDAETEGVWKWVTGPESGTVFWNGTGNGSTPNFAFWNTNNNEPNQSGNEDYAHITAPGVGIPGSWNDMSNTGDSSGNYQPKGYIIEYGGMPGELPLQISASTTMTIPVINSTIPASRCGSGTVMLQATATDGLVDWYTSSTGGIPIWTGNSFTTPIISTSTSYYVDATNGNCPTVPRTEIIATINAIPSITSTTSASRCDTGIVTLGASASAGTINWYNVQTGGSSLGTGTSFTTPSIVSTTTYYVDAVVSGCTTATRTAITATVNISPSITSTTPASRCNTGTVTLTANASAGIIKWYDAPTGGTSLGTGASFTTPNIASTTTYYVDATGFSCTTPTRTAIAAIINITPTITSTTPTSRCDTGTVTLGALASAGIINWYDVQTGGTSLGTGTSFTTPNIVSTTIYYVDAVASGCTTATRTAITATVNISPSITSTTPASRCDTGTVTLGATASAGTINWYNVPTAGTLLGTGTSFTTPSIASTTTYYVETTNQCTSRRVSVTATIYPVVNINEEVILCQTETATLDASIPGMNYLWSPGGETTQTIVVSTTGDYSVKISSPFVVSCDSKKNIKVIEHPAPIIKAIIVNENSITVELTNPENYYEYSIDGELFQGSNKFSYIQSGQHTAYVREKNLCNLVQQDFTIFTIAKYFTPNNDGFNDVWEIKEMKNAPNSSALIFDRYGKLIITLNALKYSWDGKYNNNILPASDYWYVLKIDNTKPEIRGHFSLKR